MTSLLIKIQGRFKEKKNDTALLGEQAQLEGGKLKVDVFLEIPQAVHLV